MKIQTVEGTVEYKTVTDFFNPSSYSLSENLEYNANYQAFIIEATDKLNHAITGTLPISVTDVVERPLSLLIRKRLSMMKWMRILLFLVLHLNNFGGWFENS